MVALIIVITVICFLLILVILAQNSKGGGLSSQFGGSSTSQLIGVKKTGDFLEKFTWGLAIALLVLTLSTDFLIDNDGSDADVSTSPNIQKAEDRAIVPAPDLNLDNAGGDDSTDPVGGEEDPSQEPDGE
ncbi:preprotein translocase subunit SecG [Fulvivirgaceae bacterium BMA12]|uniref:Protein-export membrane protein SecG n=1 Tax=Agaribacillus aureus TaxID=3051825 RepID=A0ABT8LBV7_9BACT|nr:preprotein translocase subunit SecG [Fulvivirgaceae bacterium BMA12]